MPLNKEPKSNINGELLTHLWFADDIVLIYETPDFNYSAQLNIVCISYRPCWLSWTIEIQLLISR